MWRPVDNSRLLKKNAWAVFCVYNRLFFLSRVNAKQAIYFYVVARAMQN